MELTIKPIIGWVAIMIDAVSAPSRPANCCPRKTKEPNPQKPIDPSSQARAMRFAFSALPFFQQQDEKCAAGDQVTQRCEGKGST